MARPVWSGTVSFGLVTIPVTMSPAVRGGRVSFHFLHATDHARLARRMVCPTHGREVEPREMVRGFEIGPEQFVVVTPEELDSLEPRRSRNIEITDFVDLAAINPLYFSRPYYLLPAGADKPYRLLAVALAETGKAGIARFVMRGHEYLSALVALEGALCLFALHYHDEVVDGSDLLPAAKAPAKEVLAAQNLVVKMKAKFQPGRHGDERRKKLLAMVKRREREAGAVEAPPAPETAEEEEMAPPDLMAALEESLSRARARAGRGK